MAENDEQQATVQQEETTTDLLAPVFGNTDLSLLDLVKIQAQVLVPVLRAFRAELGEERANQIASVALRQWSQQMFRDIGARIPGGPRQKWEAITAALRPRVGNAVDREVLKQEADAVEFNITGCRYAEFFRQLREPELGALLTCAGDLDMEAVGSPEVSMTRTQTIMQGARYCDFRFRLKGVGGAEK
jgi:hypothetical protein